MKTCYSPEFSPLGLNGAALAALGDRPEGFDCVPLTVRVAPLREAGVKLGESTFKRFFELFRTTFISKAFSDEQPDNSHLSAEGCTFMGS